MHKQSEAALLHVIFNGFVRQEQVTIVHVLIFANSLAMNALNTVFTATKVNHNPPQNCGRSEA